MSSRLRRTRVEGVVTVDVTLSLLQSYLSFVFVRLTKSSPISTRGL